MGSAFLSFVTSAPFEAFVVIVLTAIVGLIGGQHPTAANLLSYIAGWFKKTPPAAMLAVMIAVLVLADTASAGPILNRIRERRAQCQSYQPAPAYQFAPQQAGRACPNCTQCNDNCSCFGAGYYCPRVCPVQQTFGPILPQSSFPSCPGGNCQIPSRRR